MSADLPRCSVVAQTEEGSRAQCPQPSPLKKKNVTGRDLQLLVRAVCCKVVLELRVGFCLTITWR